MRTLILCLIIPAIPALATDAVLTADAQVAAAMPSTNFGAAPLMAVSSGSSAFVQFSLSTLPPGTSALDVAKATLVLYASQVNSPGTLDLATASGAWTESGLTFAGAPAVTAVPGALAAVAQAGQYVSFDVTTAVRNFINAPSANNGFVLSVDADTPGLSVAFDTKESTTSSHPARLEVELNLVGPQGPSGPAGPAGLTGPQGLAGPRGPAGANLPDRLFGTNTSWAAAGSGRPCTLGEIILNAGTVGNGLPAAGQTLTISSNIALFSVLGNTYGGDGRSNFELPDLRSMAPNGLTYTICINGVFPSPQ